MSSRLIGSLNQFTQMLKEISNKPVNIQESPFAIFNFPATYIRLSKGFCTAQCKWWARGKFVNGRITEIFIKDFGAELLTHLWKMGF